MVLLQSVILTLLHVHFYSVTQETLFNGNKNHFQVTGTAWRCKKTSNFQYLSLSLSHSLSLSPKHLPVFAMVWTLGCFHSNIHHTGDNTVILLLSPLYIYWSCLLLYPSFSIYSFHHHSCEFHKERTSPYLSSIDAKFVWVSIFQDDEEKRITMKIVYL